MRRSLILRAYLLSSAWLGFVGLIGCGGGTQIGGARNATVTVLATSTANDQLTSFDMIVTTITLTDQSGGAAALISAPINAEFLHVNGISEPLLTATVPDGVYTAATASVGSAAFTCWGIDPSNGYLAGAIYASEYTPASSVSVSLPSPVTIAGDNAAVLLDLQVPQSASYDTKDCVNTTNYSITPAFTLASATTTSPTEIGLRGLINSVAPSGGAFTVTAAEGYAGLSVQPQDAVRPVWQMTTDGATVYQGIGGVADLEAGTPVDMDAVLQPDGSLLAKRVAVYDTDPSDLTMEIGPLGYNAGISIFNGLPVQVLGPLNANVYPFNFGETAFQISGQFSNLQSLPFPASFGPSGVVPGQNVLAGTHSTEIEPAPIYLPASAIVLLPQTLNGAVSAIGSDAGFTTYAVTLAPYDLFPALAAQPGQTTLLTNPNTVVVYADSNTQMLNTNPLAVGGVARFYGLVFNDNGALRMDCAQINDGVTE